MLSWSFEFENTQYFEGFRSLATNGIDKPILNLFRMLGLMGGERVRVTSTGAVPLETLMRTGVRGAPDVDGLATREGKSAAVLVWNYHDVNEAGPAAEATVDGEGDSGGSASGAGGGVPDRCAPQQCVYGVAGDGVAAGSGCGADCAAEGGGAAADAGIAGVGGCAGWEGGGADEACRGSRWSWCGCGGSEGGKRQARGLGFGVA